MTGTIVCGVCGTVNVGVFARCIACGQDLARAPAPDIDDSDGVGVSDADVPLQQQNDVSSPVTIAPAPTSGSARPRSGQADAAADELDSASYRQTVIELPKTAALSVDPPTVAAGPRVRRAAARDTAGPTSEPGDGRGVRFVARLLLPEGDRRTMDVTKRAVVLGSGLDEFGLAGDPRAGPAEAKLYVVDGRLYVEPAPDAVNVYIRIDREMKLADGDVVLMGDVAATFEAVDLGGPVDGTRQVLGGSANAACGRLVFLRRDGSPGPIHDLPAGKTVIGRTDGHLNFSNDSRLSRRHALFFASDKGVTVEDMESRNGTYLRVRTKRELQAEDALRVGSAGVQIRTRG